MRAVITAGGTAGHINPALAIADEIIRNEPSSEIVFIGRKDGMERKLVNEAGYELREIDVHGLMRRVSPENLVFNAKAVYKALAAQKEVKRFLRGFGPDAVIGCGGYVSGPVVRAASDIGCVTVIHEQNAFPGMTTKLLAKRASLILCANEEGVDRIGYRNKTTVTGNPVRHAFFEASRQKLRDELGVGDRVFVLSFGGSNGAAGINRAAAMFISKHRHTDKVFHVHATGMHYRDSFPALLREFCIEDDCENVRVCEYISDMPEHFAACDLIISRAGALTISEIMASGKASVLIPSPNVTDNHQFYNAMSLANAGAAFVYEEKDIGDEGFVDKLMELADDTDYLKKMGENAGKLARPDAAPHIYRCVRNLLEGGKIHGIGEEPT